MLSQRWSYFILLYQKHWVRLHASRAHILIDFVGFPVCFCVQSAGTVLGSKLIYFRSISTNEIVIRWKLQMYVCECVSPIKVLLYTHWHKMSKSFLVHWKWKRLWLPLPSNIYSLMHWRHFMLNIMYTVVHNGRYEWYMCNVFWPSPLNAISWWLQQFISGKWFLCALRAFWKWKITNNEHRPSEKLLLLLLNYQLLSAICAEDERGSSSDRLILIINVIKFNCNQFWMKMCHHQRAIGRTHTFILIQLWIS